MIDHLKNEPCLFKNFGTLWRNYEVSFLIQITFSQPQMKFIQMNSNEVHEILRVKIHDTSNGNHSRGEIPDIMNILS